MSLREMQEQRKKAEQQDEELKKSTRNATRGMMVNWPERCDLAIIAKQRQYEKQEGKRILKHEAAVILMEELLDMRNNNTVKE